MKLPKPAQRQKILQERRNLKMARSAHAYVRGSTIKFYEWLDQADVGKVPEGPAIWICGDCHVGNLGPVANVDGSIDMQIRDFDQTVIGNPVHDLIRLGLSLTMAARSSDLPGVTTAKMMEQLIEGYAQEFCEGIEEMEPMPQPASVHAAMKEAAGRNWKHLARERIKNTKPTIPLGKRFWPTSAVESRALSALFGKKMAPQIATILSTPADDMTASLVDAAYWVKGCSSLGKLRFATLLEVQSRKKQSKNIALIDIKEATTTGAPRSQHAKMPQSNAERVMTGARHLSPYLGERMFVSNFLDHQVFVRELLPQDLKLEIDKLTRTEAMKTARYLAGVVGKAHARQMDVGTRTAWRKEIIRNRSKKLDAPSWLWNSIVELVATHEAAYLEHCRNYALHISEEKKND